LRADQILAALERISLEKLTCEHTGKLAERSALARHGGTCFRAEARPSGPRLAPRR
jgi:hypothetical protein